MTITTVQKISSPLTVSGRTMATVLDAVARVCSEALGGDEHVFAAGITQEVTDVEPMVLPLADDFAEAGMPACTIGLGEWSPVLLPVQERLTITVMGAIWRHRVPLAENAVGLYDDRDRLADAFIRHAYAFGHHEHIQSVILMGGPGIRPRTLPHGKGSALFLTLPFTVEVKLMRAVTPLPE